MRWHHDPANVNTRAPTLVAILHLATHVYNLYAGKDDSDWPEQEIATLEELGIARDELQEYVEDVHERAAEA